jgi:hypothetical protein
MRNNKAIKGSVITLLFLCGYIITQSRHPFRHPCQQQIAPMSAALRHRVMGAGKIADFAQHRRFMPFPRPDINQTMLLISR